MRFGNGAFFRQRQNSEIQNEKQKKKKKTGIFPVYRIFQQKVLLLNKLSLKLISDFLTGLTANRSSQRTDFKLNTNEISFFFFFLQALVNRAKVQSLNK